MNTYRIVILSCGMARELIIPAYDIVQAIQSAGAMPSEVIRAELVGSTNINDMVG